MEAITKRPGEGTPVDLSHIPGHFPNIPPYPTIDPNPTWFGSMASMNVHDVKVIAGSTAFMFVAGALGGELRTHAGWLAGHAAC